ncbi:DM13 domain-containing protein [Streptomyces sp. NPDC051561]|uniref:DM13 domain-containing protein n=1 Tax=Streptomyces sp. NPDC051561 TaxID=3365658 RepID=UPI00378A49B9
MDKHGFLRFLRRPVVLAALVVAVLAAGFGAYWFQPWKLVTDTTVRDELPMAAVPTSADGTKTPARDGMKETPVPAGPMPLSAGNLISHEHATSGTVKVLRLPDGSRTLRIENLDTSDGPDLRVLLSDAKVVPGKAGWHVFDDGTYTTLAKLKGNKGDQNYALPADLDLKQFRSVSIWCDRFDVSFGAAELAPT